MGSGRFIFVSSSLFLLFVLFKNAFDLVFFRADAVGLVPMDLSLAYRTIAEAHGGVTFELAPAAFAVNLAKTFALPDRGSRCDCLYAADRAEDFEAHRSRSPLPDCTARVSVWESRSLPA